MSYQVLARKYRPLRFDEVVGQVPIVRTLQNAIRQDRLAHAYLFAGPRGVGKTSIARILAKALNCPRQNDGIPCNQCEVCKGISAGEDIDVLEIDGASNNGVEEVRTLREAARYAPSRCPHKIYIIDEVHMLSTAAFNALLKTLEEPPPHVLFFFATTDPQKLPATIHSRCQRFNFHRIPPGDLVGALRETCKREGVEVEDGALWSIAHRSGGSLRDGLSLLDQSLSYGAGSVTEASVREMLGLLEAGEILTMVGQLRDGDAPGVLRSLDGLLREGADLGDFVGQAVQILRDILVLKVSPEAASLIERSREETERLAQEAGGFTTDTLLHYLAVLQETRGHLRRDSLPRIRVEVALVELARLPRLASLDEIASRLGAGSGAAGTAGPRAAPKERSNPAAAAPPPVAAGASPDPARAAPVAREVGAIWDDAIKTLHGSKPTLGSILDLMRPLTFEAGVLTVAYPEESRMMVEQALGSPARKKAVEDILGGMGHGPIRIRTVLDEEGAARPSAKDHPHVKAAREILGGTEGKEKEERR